MMATELRARLLPLAARRADRPAITGSGRVLIVQPDHLGDIILSEPAVRLLRAALPDRELIAVVGPWSAEIASMAWPVDDVVEVDFPAFARSTDSKHPLQPYRYLRGAIARLRSIEADDAIVLRDDAWWAAWLARSSVGRHVITSDDRQTGVFATHPAHIPHTRHRTAVAVEIAAAFLSESGIELDLNDWDMSPRIVIYDGSPQTATSVAGSANSHPTFIIHPGSGAEVKSWPLHHWQALIRRLSDAQLILTGSAGERVLCDAIAEPFPNATSVAGETTLRELAARLRGATVAVGTDNGPMHLAGALGVPTVRLFGPSNPERYGPWPGTPGQIVIHVSWSCPQCEDLSPGRTAGCGCMLAIDPDQVVAAVREAINGAT